MKISSLFSLSFFFTTAVLADIKCNRSSFLCDKKYDQVIYPTTHNATAKRSGKHMVWFVPNQETTVLTQLNDGIRAMMIDIMYYDGIKKKEKGKAYNCHSTCKLGGQPLSTTLGQIKFFLENNPNEVLTLILENYISHKDLLDAFTKAGLSTFLYLPNSSWPTLRQMIETNQRLVVLTDTKDEFEIPWLLYLWDEAVETKYSFKKIKDYDCSFNRGQGSNNLFILNHFITTALFRRAHNRSSNKLHHLLKRAQDCHQETGKIPNFLTVDFYKTGEIIKAVEILNNQF